MAEFPSSEASRANAGNFFQQVVTYAQSIQGGFEFLLDFLRSNPDGRVDRGKRLNYNILEFHGYAGASIGLKVRALGTGFKKSSPKFGSRVPEQQSGTGTSKLTRHIIDWHDRENISFTAVSGIREYRAKWSYQRTISD